MINHIINTGVSKQIGEKEARRIRMTNIISLIGIIVFFLSSVIFYVAYQNWARVIPLLLGAVMLYIPIFFNRLNQQELAKWMLATNIILYLVISCLMYGINGGLDSVFVISCVIPALIFQSTRQSIQVFAFNFVCFLFVRFGYNYIPPVLAITVKSEYDSIATMNLFTCMSVLFIVILRLKDEHEHYESEIIEINEELTQMNNELTDSIRYAKRIQTAILPPESVFLSAFDDYFIFYRPRNIVSGDFYYFQTLENGSVLLAVADCTGHGVPGAFMSMIGHDLLNEIIMVRGIYLPDLILKQLHEGVRLALKQKETQNTDGMDISILHWSSNERKLTFAGAKSPMLLVRNAEAKEVKGDKWSIGGEINQSPQFTAHEMIVPPSSWVYLYSDGFQDQFGGKENKKFYSRNLRQLLVRISTLKGKEQEKELGLVLNKWMNYPEIEQTDDILVLGLAL